MSSKCTKRFKFTALKIQLLIAKKSLIFNRWQPNLFFQTKKWTLNEKKVWARDKIFCCPSFHKNGTFLRVLKRGGSMTKHSLKHTHTHTLSLTHTCTHMHTHMHWFKLTQATHSRTLSLSLSLSPSPPFQFLLNLEVQLDSISPSPYLKKK